MLWGATAPVVPFLLWSCNSHPLEAPKPNPIGELNQLREVNAVKAVDIVFMVDDSGSMQQEQRNLTRNFNTFMRELGGIPGADLHIAVVSSDLGSGAGSPNMACNTMGGDHGVFCRVRGQDKCAECGVDVTKGRFLQTINPNFPAGTLVNTFGCMATLGTDGCGFEHQIGGLRNSLTAAENGGFLRDDAYLAFVLITDEDDCTAPADSQMFSMQNPGQDWSLRCALEGHVCDGRHPTGAEDVNLTFDHCAAATDGQLVPLPDLVDAVMKVKKDPNLIIASGIFGWPLPADERAAPYQINLADGQSGAAGERTLRPVCQSANGTATVGYRVKKFVESFKNHSTFSICQDDFTAALQQIGEKIRAVVGSPCVDAKLVDTNLATKDMDPDCVVSEQAPNADEVLLPRCKGGETSPCWNLVGEPTCLLSAYKIEIDRKGQDLPEGTAQTIRCLTVTN